MERNTNQNNDQRYQQISISDDGEFINYRYVGQGPPPRHPNGTVFVTRLSQQSPGTPRHVMNHSNRQDGPQWRRLLNRGNNPSPVSPRSAFVRQATDHHFGQDDRVDTPHFMGALGGMGNFDIFQGGDVTITHDTRRNLLAAIQMARMLRGMMQEGTRQDEDPNAPLQGMFVELTQFDEDEVQNVMNQTFGQQEEPDHPLTPEQVQHAIHIHVQLDQRNIEGITREYEDECVICKEKFAVGDTVNILRCKHPFHEGCLSPWFRINNTCPTCRRIYDN